MAVLFSNVLFKRPARAACSNSLQTASSHGLNAKWVVLTGCSNGLFKLPDHTAFAIYSFCLFFPKLCLLGLQQYPARTTPEGVTSRGVGISGRYPRERRRQKRKQFFDHPISYYDFVFLNDTSDGVMRFCDPNFWTLSTLFRCCDLFFAIAPHRPPHMRASHALHMHLTCMWHAHPTCTFGYDVIH